MNNITRPIKTKIVATLGPATSDLETIKNLVYAGATVFRLNFSHGKHVDHKSRFALVRQVEKELGVHLAILADLQGPKIRIGAFENGEVSLRRNQLFTFVLDKSVGTEDQVWLPHREVFESVLVGDILLIDDGRTRMETVSVSSNKISARVLHDTIISDSKGINFPDTDLKLPALTDKDLTDLEFAITLGADWIALSFVQDSNDVMSARELIGQKAKIISKIEKPLALKDIDAIIDQSDAIMVARGDLGVECAWHDIPAIQNKLVQASRAAGKPVVVATQMLESMIQAAVPTRAEVSDVANAVAQGADAVMLSAETATGSFPIEAVTAMADISRSTTKHLSKSNWLTPSLDTDDNSMSIASAAAYIAQMRDASCIVTFSETGATALRVAKGRPSVPILAVCQEPSVARMLALVWGVITKVSNDASEFERSRNGDISPSLFDFNMIKSKRPIVVTSGSVFGAPGGTDSIKIAYVENKN